MAKYLKQVPFHFLSLKPFISLHIFFSFSHTQCFTSHTLFFPIMAPFPMHFSVEQSWSKGYVLKRSMYSEEYIHSHLPCKISHSMHLLVSRPEQTSPLVPMGSPVVKTGRGHLTPSSHIRAIRTPQALLLHDALVSRCSKFLCKRHLGFLRQAYCTTGKVSSITTKERDLFYGKSWLSFAWYSWSAAIWADLRSCINAMCFRWHKITHSCLSS